MSDPMLSAVIAASDVQSSGPPTMRTDSEAEPGRADPTDEEETFAAVYAEGMPQTEPPAVPAEPGIAASDAQVSDQPVEVAASSEEDARQGARVADPGESAAASERPPTSTPTVVPRPASFGVTDLEARTAATAAALGEINHPDPRAALSDDERAGKPGPEGLSVLRKLSTVQAGVLRRQLQGDDEAAAGYPYGYGSGDVSESPGGESPGDSSDSSEEEEPTEVNARARAIADALERPHRTLAPLGAVGATAYSDTGVLRHSVGVDGLPGPSTLSWPVSKEDAHRDVRAADPGEPAAVQVHPPTSPLKAAPQVFNLAESPPSFEEFEVENGTRGEPEESRSEGGAKTESDLTAEEARGKEEERPGDQAAEQAPESAWVKRLRQIAEFVAKWGLQDRMHQEMRAWQPEVCAAVLSEFKPFGPKQKAWDGMVIALKVKITHRLRAAREYAEEQRRVAAEQERIAAQREAEEAEERSSSSEYDGGEREKELLRQLRARGADRAMWYGEGSFIVAPGLRKVFRDWAAEGPLPGVLHDFVLNLSQQERAAIKMNIAVREAAEEGLLVIQHTPVKEMEAFAAAQAAQFAEADNREGQPGEFRFPFAKDKREREEEAEDRRAIAQALAERHNQSIEWGMHFLRNRRRLALMPYEDWRDGAMEGPRLPSLFPQFWTSQNAARGGPPMGTEERQQYQLPHPEFEGEWGRMRSHLYAQCRNEFASTSWRDLGLRHRGKIFRTQANAQRDHEARRIATALSKGGVPASLPTQADRVWVSSWFATGLVKAVKYSGGGWKHPNPRGALADNESNRVPLDPDEVALFEAQIADHARREHEGSATWGRPASLEAELWEASANRKEDGAFTDDGEVEELYEIARASGGVKKSVNAYGERCTKVCLRRGRKSGI